MKQKKSPQKWGMFSYPSVYRFIPSRVEGNLIDHMRKRGLFGNNIKLFDL